MKKILPFIIAVLLGTLSTSCFFDVNEAPPVESVDMTFAFRLEVSSDAVARASSAGSNYENLINTSELIVLAYKADGTYVGEMPVLSCTDNGDATYDFVCAFRHSNGVKVGDEFKFMVLANCIDPTYRFSYKEDGTPNLAALMFATPAQRIPMWGVATHEMEDDGDGKTLKEDQAVGDISVLRALGKVGIKLSQELKNEGFRIKELKLNYARSSGYSVPEGWDKAASTVEVQNAGGFRDVTTEGTMTRNINAATMGMETGAYYIYVPETANSDPAYVPEGEDPAELSIAVVVERWEEGECVETWEFPYSNGIKFRKYVNGDPTEEKFNIVRNHFYDYTVTAINTSIELDLVEYETLPWVEKEVSIDQVKFLVLNTDLVKIYNENVDDTSLKFISSSPIKSVVLKDSYEQLRNGSFVPGEDGVSAYYLSKFGVPVQLGTDPGFAVDNLDELLAREQVVLENISAVADADVAQGAITITSPFIAMSGSDVPDALKEDSHYDTVRYLEFEVTNEQGLTATFRVMQYPPVVITSEEGYFSYRDDQKLTDDQEEATHFHNYQGSYSFHLTGLYFYHEHEWTKEFEMTEDWWNENPNERDYSWVVPTACPTNNQNDGSETVHYGNIGNPVTWHNSKGVLQSKVYGGLYRPTEYPTDYFYRWRYNGIGASNNDSQGLSIGGIYPKEVVVDGEIQTRWYRKHYVWNIQVIYYNLYVGKIYQQDEGGKLKGQSDIYSMTHATTTYKDEPGTGWGPWGKQKYTNHRMYNIRSMYPSPDYVVAKVDLVDKDGNKTTDADKGMTANTGRNANIVSPSFMVASELGETHYQSIINSAAGYKYKVPNIAEFYKMAEAHCREYVETTYEDLNNNYQWDAGEPVTHYHDWRLPTRAEVDMIIDYQMNSRTMDRVLNNQYYFCITGNADSEDLTDIHNWVSAEVPGYRTEYTGYHIRCVRDVK